MTLDDDELKIVPERDAVSTVRRPSGTPAMPLLWFAVAALVIALGALFYQNTQLSGLIEEQKKQFEQHQSNLDKQQKNYAQAENRILALESKLTATGRDLEDKLTATDRTLSKSGSSLEKRISESEHEIRKLWDLSNKRNKVDIASQGKQVKALSAKVDILQTDISKQQSSTNKAFSKIEANVKKELNIITQAATVQQKKQADFVASLEGNAEQISVLVLQNQALDNRAKTLTKDTAALTSKLRELDTQKKLLVKLEKKFSQLDVHSQTDIKVLLDEYAERLDAIDASRRQLTSSVTRLTTDVNQLQLDVNKL